MLEEALAGFIELDETRSRLELRLRTRLEDTNVGEEVCN